MFVFCQGLNFNGADLSRLDLRYINFKMANLRGTNLTHSNLSGANLERADLSMASLDVSVMTGLLFQSLGSNNSSKETIHAVKTLSNPEPGLLQGFSLFMSPQTDSMLLGLVFGTS